MAVLVTVATGDRVFCGGMRWVPHARRPSLPAIRREALSMGMTNYVRPRQMPNRIGYLKIIGDNVAEKQAAKGNKESLLLAVLSQSEPLTYIECDFGPNGTWVMATDENGLPLPGSDNFFIDEDLDGYRSSLVGFTFQKKLIVGEDQIDNFLSNLPSSPVAIRSISFRHYYIGAGLLIIGALVILQSMHIIHERNLEKLRLETQRNFLLAQQKAQAATHEDPSPGEWVKICMHNAYALSPYKNGWTLSSWECAGRTLSALWIRTGGTIADAPMGLMLNNGNSVRSHYPLLPFEKIHGVSPDAIGDAKAFIAFVQQSETNLSVKTADLVHGDKADSQSAYMITFSWQGDPREIPWDSFRDISIERLGREVNANAGVVSQQTDYQIHVAIKAKLPADGGPMSEGTHP